MKLESLIAIFLFLLFIQNSNKNELDLDTIIELLNQTKDEYQEHLKETSILSSKFATHLNIKEKASMVS